MSVRLAVFASGGGSNLQAILDRFAGSIYTRVALVVSDRAGSGALGRARAADVPAVHIRVGERSDDDVAAEMLAALDAERVDMVALAGYLRLVPAAVVEQFAGRMLNIHPALLPAFGGPGMYGRHVHAAVLATGCTVTGATVHHVEERYDEGRVIAQWPVPVLPQDSVESLAARVLRIEHWLYPAVIDAVSRDVSGSSPIAADTFQLGGITPPADEHIIALARI